MGLAKQKVQTGNRRRHIGLVASKMTYTLGWYCRRYYKKYGLRFLNLFRHNCHCKQLDKCKSANPLAGIYICKYCNGKYKLTQEEWDWYWNEMWKSSHNGEDFDPTKVRVLTGREIHEGIYEYLNREGITKKLRDKE